MNRYGKIDLHMHSTVSDGTDSPENILSHVTNSGISFFSLTDHDATKGCKIIRSILEKSKTDTNSALTFITGVEFSCKDEKGKYHILGYGYDPEGSSIRTVVENGHMYRMSKVCARLDFIKKEYGFSFPKEEIDTLLAMDNPGKPHIGNLMIKYGYAQTLEQAIKNYIDKIHFKSDYVRPEEAICGIRDAGGIPVLAHPFFGSGDGLIIGKEMEERLGRLIEFGIQGVEAFYSGFSPKQINEMVSMANRYNLYVTAGSDYHGKNKLIELGDTGMDINDSVPVRLKRFIDVLKMNPNTISTN